MAFERRSASRYNGGMVRTIVLSMILAGLALASPNLQAGETESDAAVARGRVAYDDGDYDAAYKEWLPLAEAGNADAQFGMGSLFNYGHDRPEDLGVAVLWYAKAAKQGHTTALDWLGDMYVKGEGVPRDLKRAECLYLHAARRGNFRAKRNLYDFYRKLGRNEEAKVWQARILAKSTPRFLFAIGRFGLTFPGHSDPEESYAFLLLAKERGSREAAEYLRLERSTLDPRVHIRLLGGWWVAKKWRALKATPMTPPNPVEDACLPH